MTIILNLKEKSCIDTSLEKIKYMNLIKVQDLMMLVILELQLIMKINSFTHQIVFLYCEGELVVKDGDENYNKGKTGISLIRNGLFYLFKCIE